METLYLYLFLVGLAWSILNRYLTTKKRNKERNLPPTPWLAITKIVFHGLLKQPLHQTLFQIANRHGEILLLFFRSKPILVISSAKAAEDLFTNSDKVFANRPELTPAKAFGCNGTDLAWAPHGCKWRKLRRVACLDMLRFHRLPEQHDSLADEVKQLLTQLYCNQEVSVNLKPMFQELVFNVMMRMFAGKRYCLKKTTEGEENKSRSLLENSTSSFRITTCDPDLPYFMPILKSFSDLEEKCTQLKRDCDLLMDNIINEIRNGCQKEKNVIQFLLDKQQNKKDPDKQNKKDPDDDYTDKIIRGLVLSLVSAGTDTSAGILEWALSLLLNHPEVLLKAQEEIDKHVGNNRFLKQSDITRLHYLRCIVKETMRLYPVAPLLVPHESKEECKVLEYNVPKGTMLMLNAWAIHNDPRTWDEPTKFNPERFKDIVDECHGCKLMTFGYGRRSCPGKHMATRVITYALGSLIHCFDWDRDSMEMVDLTEQMGLALFKDKPLMAKCRPRSMMKTLLSQI